MADELKLKPLTEAEFKSALINLIEATKNSIRGPNAAASEAAADGIFAQIIAAWHVAHMTAPTGRDVQAAAIRVQGMGDADVALFAKGDPDIFRDVAKAYLSMADAPTPAPTTFEALLQQYELALATSDITHAKDSRAALLAHVASLTKERDTWRDDACRKYPTPEAYDAVCAARTKWQDRAEKAEAALAEARNKALDEAAEVGKKMQRELQQTAEHCLSKMSRAKMLARSVCAGEIATAILALKTKETHDAG